MDLPKIWGADTHVQIFIGVQTPMAHTVVVANACGFAGPFNVIGIVQIDVHVTTYYITADGTMSLNELIR